MKILLINGSLRGDYSSSLKVAHAFVKGMVEEYGADTEVCEVALKDKRIDHCHGCFVCWKTTPGQCCIHDDMDELRQMVMDSDIIVESFPLYFFGLPSKLKAFTDRMISYVQEYRGNPGDEENHRFLHNMRYPELEKKKLILVSTCGYEVTDNCYDAVFAERRGKIHNGAGTAGGSTLRAGVCREGGTLSGEIQRGWSRICKGRLFIGTYVEQAAATVAWTQYIRDGNQYELGQPGGWTLRKAGVERGDTKEICSEACLCDREWRNPYPVPAQGNVGRQKGNERCVEKRQLCCLFQSHKSCGWVLYDTTVW